jgi:hypothetical protein
LQKVHGESREDCIQVLTLLHQVSDEVSLTVNAHLPSFTYFKVLETASDSLQA